MLAPSLKHHRDLGPELVVVQVQAPLVHDEGVVRLQLQVMLVEVVTHAGAVLVLVRDRVRKDDAARARRDFQVFRDDEIARLAVKP